MTGRKREPVNTILHQDTMPGLRTKSKQPIPTPGVTPQMNMAKPKNTNNRRVMMNTRMIVMNTITSTSMKKIIIMKPIIMKKMTTRTRTSRITIIQDITRAVSGGFTGQL